MASTDASVEGWARVAREMFTAQRHHMQALGAPLLRLGERLLQNEQIQVRMVPSSSRSSMNRLGGDDGAVLRHRPYQRLRAGQGPGAHIDLWLIVDHEPP